jgi:succinyl-CoA synthetase alpha subunit
MLAKVLNYTKAQSNTLTQLTKRGVYTAG